MKDLLFFFVKQENCLCLNMEYIYPMYHIYENINLDIKDFFF